MISFKACKQYLLIFNSTNLDKSFFSMSRIFSIIINTILSFNVLYSQTITNDYNFLFPESNLEIKYHDEWGAKNYKDVINNFKNNPLKFNQIVFLGNSITAEGGNWGEKLNYSNKDHNTKTFLTW